MSSRTPTQATAHRLLSYSIATPVLFCASVSTRAHNQWTRRVLNPPDGSQDMQIKLKGVWSLPCIDTERCVSFPPPCPPNYPTSNTTWLNENNWNKVCWVFGGLFRSKFVNLQDRVDSWQLTNIQRAVWEWNVSTYRTGVTEDGWKTSENYLGVNLSTYWPRSTVDSWQISRQLFGSKFVNLQDRVDSWQLTKLLRVVWE